LEHLDKHGMAEHAARVEPKHGNIDPEHRHLLPAPSCSPCLRPGWSHHTLRSRKPQRNLGTDHLIPVTNPIESVFATVRHRTVRTKEALSAKTAKLMVFKLVDAAAKTWRRLKGENQLPKVIAGIKFQNGIEVIKMPAHHAA
jgi:hypothetical protein